MATNEDEIKVGDVVRVRGIEGPAWVVENVDSAPGYPDRAQCLRFDGGTAMAGASIRDAFPVAVLERAAIDVEARSQAAVAMRNVLQTIPSGERSGDTFLTKLLSPFFRRLSLDVQARLARDTMLDLAAAYILVKERLGTAGNVRLDGNECQIGTVTACGDFDILARGQSWEAAWKQLSAPAQPPSSSPAGDQ